MRERHARSLETFRTWFWTRVDSSGGPTACWPYLGSKLPAGYGQISAKVIRGGKLTNTQDVAYFLEHGSLPQHQGNHTCDNPPCCNPAHIFDAPQLANVRDSVKKGRARGRFSKPKPTGDFSRPVVLKI
jgi:hypothetical protein